MVGKQNTVPALTALKSRGGDSHEAGHSIVMRVIKVKQGDLIYSEMWGPFLKPALKLNFEG